MNKKIETLTNNLCDELSKLSFDEQVQMVNYIRYKIHKKGPFKNQPIDLVLWEKTTNIQANDYNPNRVAPPEMKLLTTSIKEDGYTQPIVVFKDRANYTVVDGFHRQDVGRNTQSIFNQLNGYLPITLIRAEKEGKNNRIASTIRHNRARGTHSIDMMRDIVADLIESGMSDQWILKNIGMDADELLRLKQISGLASLFTNHGFSMAWVTEDENNQMMSESDDAL